MEDSDLYSLLPSLFDLFDYEPDSGFLDSIMEKSWQECLNSLEKSNQLLIESDQTRGKIQIEECWEKDNKTKAKYTFRTLGEYVWKFKFEEKLSDELNNKNDKIIDDFDKKMHDLNLHLFSPYIDMDIMHELFQKAITNAIANTKNININPK